MRFPLIATATLASVAMAGPAGAQVGPRWAGTAPHSSLAAAAPGPMPAPASRPAPPTAAPVGHPAAIAGAQGWHGHAGNRGGHSRWGARDHGRWWGGWRAPGGWGAYRRPYRGWRLPGYWISPGFYIGDYSNYGLGAPPPGYNWSRYYDDAVLIDRDGQVRDSVDGIDCDGYPDAYDDGGPQDGPLNYDPYYHDYGADHEAPPYGYGDRGPPPPPPPPGPGYPPPPPPHVEQYGAGCNCGGGTWVNGWWYPPATTTVITVPGHPVTTTRTYTDYVTTYRSGYRPVRHWRHTKLLPRPTKLVARHTKLVPR